MRRTKTDDFFGLVMWGGVHPNDDRLDGEKKHWETLSTKRRRILIGKKKTGFRPLGGHPTHGGLRTDDLERGTQNPCSYNLRKNCALLGKVWEETNKGNSGMRGLGVELP